MALINCPECTNQLSDSVKTCPHCGFQLIKGKPSTPPVRIQGKKTIKMSIIFLCFFCFTSFAHAPHDEISDVFMISDNNLEFLYVISRSSLYRKSDDNSFKRVVKGLDNTKFLQSLTMTKAGEKMLFLTSAGDGVYISSDLGNSWKKSNSGLSNPELHLIESSGYRPGFVLTCGLSSGLYYSVNNGDSWQEFVDFNTKLITALCEIPDGYLFSDNQSSIFKLDLKTLKIKKIFQLESEYGRINSLASLNSDLENKELLIGSDFGALRLSSKEVYNVDNITGIPDGKIMDIQSSLSDDLNEVIYVLHAYKGFYISTDGGVTFNRDSKGLSSHQQADKFNVPYFSHFKVFESAGNENVFVCGFDGLFRHKHNRAWVQEETLSENLMVEINVSPNYLSDSSIVALTYLKGPVISINGGRNWDKKLSGSIITEHLLSAGKIRCHDAYFCGNNTELWLSSLTNIHVLDFQDKKWKTHPICRKDNLVKRVFPSKTSNSGIADADCPGIRRIRRINNSEDIIACSNGGKNVLIYNPDKESLISHMYLDQKPTSFEISPTFNLDSIFVAGSASEGIFIVKKKKIIYRNDSIGNQCTVAISPAFLHDSTIFCGSTKGLFKLKSGVNKWEKPDANINGYVVSLALSPNFENDGTILLTQKGKGLYKSIDGGNSFVRINDHVIQNEEFAPIPFFPSNSGAIKFSGNYATDSTIFAYSGESVFKSINAGLNWLKLPDTKLEYSNKTITYLRGAVYEFREVLIFLILPSALLLVFVLIFVARIYRKFYQVNSRFDNLDNL